MSSPTAPAPTIGLFPSTSALATSTTAHLLSPHAPVPPIPPSSLVLISRHDAPSPVPASHAGATYRKASYDSSPEDLAAAFAGLDVLFLVSYPSHVHALRTRLHRHALAAARAAGVRHVFYSSLAFAGPAEGRASRAVVMQAHLDTEAHLRELAAGGGGRGEGFSFTSIREGLYSESFPIYTAFFNPVGAEKAAKEICIPHDGTGPGVAWAKRDELGEATARLIARFVSRRDAFPEGFVNGVVLLTGPEAWTLGETARVLSEVATENRDEIRIREVSKEEYAAQDAVRSRFGSVEMGVSWASAWDAIKGGETAVVTETLGELLGRRPERFEETVRRMYGK